MEIPAAARLSTLSYRRSRITQAREHKQHDLTSKLSPSSALLCHLLSALHAAQDTALAEHVATLPHLHGLDHVPWSAERVAGTHPSF